MAIRNHTLILAAAAAALLSAAGCGGKSAPAAAAGKDVACTVASARQQEIPLTVTAVGSLEADNSAMISTRMMGWVKQVYVNEGQAVRKGDRLLSIDDGDLRAKQAQAEAGLAAAQAVLANARKMAERFENLYAEKSVSKRQLDDVLTGRDQAAAGVEMARAGLAEVEVHLGYLDIKAPSDGVIARKMIEPGNMANPGMPLLILEQAKVIKVVGHLGERDINALAVGDEVTVDVTSLPGAVFRAPVTSITQTANAGSRTYDFEVLLDNADGRLKSGMFARITVPVGARQAVLVPADAVVRRGQLTGVWIVGADGKAALRWVRLGRPQGEAVEVLSGLDGGETLILSSELPLAEGDGVVN